MDAATLKQAVADTANQVPAAAAAVREAILSGEIDRGLAEIAALAADPRVPMRERATALLAVAEVCAVVEREAPEVALDAVDDVALVDAAIDLEVARALTGVLAAAPPDPVTQATRALVAHKLLAAGERGLNVTCLLVDAGLWDHAVKAAADELIGEIAPLGATEIALAWAKVALDWMRRYPERIFAPMAAELAARHLGAPVLLARLFKCLPGADPALVARARLVLRRALDAAMPRAGR